MSVELALLGEILQLSRDPNGNLEDFGAKVASSPNLAAEVVRVANSALYGVEGKVNRLDRAVLILGMRSVASIASSILLAKRMRTSAIASLSGDALWMHSLQIGLGAQLIARCLNLSFESEAYLAGLLHDLGILEMEAQHGARYTNLHQVGFETGPPLHMSERDTFGETHGEFLQQRMTEWGFPTLLGDAVGAHHNPESAPEYVQLLSAVVHAAHLLQPEEDAGWTDHQAGESDDALLEGLGLMPDDVEDVRAELAEQLKRVAPVMG